METLKQRLQRGERVNVFAVGRLLHPSLIQMFAIHGGYQGFWIDHEHAGPTIAEIEACAMSGRACGLDSFVRLAPTDYAIVTRCLESGVGGVMAAQINTAADAERFIQWSKFAPRGKRGLNAGGHDGQFNNLPLVEFCERANRDSFVAIQIETRSAVEHCASIAAIDGVDLLFIGPADLSQELGVTGQFLHPDCLAAIDRVAAACRTAGKTWGAVTTSPEHAVMLLEKGCSMLSPTNDVRAFNAGIRETRQQFACAFS